MLGIRSGFVVTLVTNLVTIVSVLVSTVVGVCTTTSCTSSLYIVVSKSITLCCVTQRASLGICTSRIIPRVTCCRDSCCFNNRTASITCFGCRTIRRTCSIYRCSCSSCMICTPSFSGVIVQRTLVCRNHEVISLSSGIIMENNQGTSCCNLHLIDFVSRIYKGCLCSGPACSTITTPRVCVNIRPTSCVFNIYYSFLGSIEFSSGNINFITACIESNRYVFTVSGDKLEFVVSTIISVRSTP